MLEQYYLWAGSAGLIILGLVILWRDRARNRREPRRTARGPEHAAAVAHAIAERRRAVIASTTVTVAPGRRRAGDAVLVHGSSLPSQVGPRSGEGTAVTAAPPAAVTPAAESAPLPEALPEAVVASPFVRSQRGQATDLSGLALLRSTLTRVEVEWDDEARPEAVRNPSAERRWGQLAPTLARAARDVNDVLESAGLSIGPAGEASWSFKNRGFGEFRRVRLEGASAAWLRLEVTIEGSLEATMRMHDDVRSFLDDRAIIDAGDVTLATGGDVIAAVLVRLAEYAARSRPRRLLEAEEAKRAWDTHASAIVGAIEAANARLTILKGRLEASGPPRLDPETRRFRLALALSAGGVPYGSVALSCGQSEIGCALEPPVGVAREFASHAVLPEDQIDSNRLSMLLVETTTPLLAHAMGDAAE